MRISSIIIAIIVCAGIAGFIFRNDFNAYLNTSLLEDAYKNAKTEYEREHVTPYIIKK